MARNRLLAVGFVALFVCSMRGFSAWGAQGPEWLVLVALPLGYGHLLGAALFSRRRRGRGPAPLLTGAFAGVSVLTLLAAYTWALHTPALRMGVLVPLLGVSAWHIAENDLALGRACREGLRLAPVPRGLRHHLLAAAWTAGVGGLALSTLTGGQYALLAFGRLAVPIQRCFSLDELAAAVLLYHAVSWILFFLDRARALPAPAAGRLRRRLFWLHAIPLAVNAALYVWAPALHVYVAAPALYLFWSALHAAQTAAARGLEPRASASPAWASA